MLTLKDLEKDNPEAEHIYLTKQTIIELSKGLPIDCGSVILIPPIEKRCLK